MGINDIEAVALASYGTTAWLFYIEQYSEHIRCWWGGGQTGAASNLRFRWKVQNKHRMA